jgi:FkbM family methyltransferase
MQKKIPFTHQIAYEFSRRGFRGSSIAWKIARKIAKDSNGELVVMPNGFPIKIDQTDWIARTIYEGTYERPLLLLLNIINVEGCFVDVGANIGVTLWNGMKGSEFESTYCAIEPSEQCQQGLKLSTQNINNSGKVLNIAIGDRSEMRLMHGLNNPEQSGGASLIQHDGLNGEDVPVQVRTLDELIFEQQIPGSVYLLKVDTEGYEAQVLAGGKLLVSRQEVRIFILEVSPSFCSTDWVEDLHLEISSNYTFFRLTERGTFRMKPKLIEVSLEEALNIEEQWNLVIIRNDIFATNPELNRVMH